jgi:hypothetical protein
MKESEVLKIEESESESESELFWTDSSALLKYTKSSIFNFLCKCCNMSSAFKTRFQNSWFSYFNTTLGMACRSGDVYIQTFLNFGPKWKRSSSCKPWLKSKLFHTTRSNENEAVIFFITVATIRQMYYLCSLENEMGWTVRLTVGRPGDILVHDAVDMPVKASRFELVQRLPRIYTASYDETTLFRIGYFLF